MSSKISILILSLSLLIGCRTKEKDDRTEFFPQTELKPKVIASKENIWVFILAGQSNMAGRGQVEPNDTIPNSEFYLLISKES